MAVSVTRHDEITGPADWKYLTCGVDTLDLGYYVDWGATWHRVEQLLALGRQAAERTKGIQWEAPTAEPSVIYANGRPPNYRYHLRLPWGELYIANQPKPRNSPNVYASLSAESLWKLGIDEVLRRVQKFIKYLQGKVLNVVPSRCDLCADFLIPSRLSLDFLTSHRVSHVRKYRHYLNGNDLETFYIADGSSALQGRIYDKGLEIKSSNKPWFLDVWNLPSGDGVWRVECQIRRPMLKQFRIDSLEAFLKQRGFLWDLFTGSYFKLCLPDDTNNSRRSLHPWWLAVSDVASIFGDPTLAPAKRDIVRGASVEWYVAHIAGCLMSMAVRLGLDTSKAAIDALAAAMHQRWPADKFNTHFIVESIKFGMPVMGEGAGHAESE